MEARVFPNYMSFPAGGAPYTCIDSRDGKSYWWSGAIWLPWAYTKTPNNPYVFGGTKP